MNVTFSYPQPSKSRIWFLPACYLLIAMLIQICVVLIHSQIIKNSTMDMAKLRDPVLIVLITTHLWIALRFILRKHHRLLVHHLLQHNRLCELRYYHRKSLNRQRNQLLISALTSLVVLYITQENTMVAPYPNATCFMLIVFIFLLITNIFIWQCASLPTFLYKQFLPESTYNCSDLQTTQRILHVTRLIIGQLLLSLFLWPAISGFYPAFTAVCMIVSVITLVIVSGLVYQGWLQSKRAEVYRSCSLKSVARKLYFLQNQRQYPEQARQLAIKKLQQQRSELNANHIHILSRYQNYIVVGAVLVLPLLWIPLW